MSYILEKPYTDEQYADFVVEHNHNNGRRIEFGENAVYALEANEKLGEDGVPVINENFEAEKAALRRQYLDGLYLTAADVERAIYQVKGIDFDDLISLVEQSGNPDIDIKALKIELRANNFYRGNPYIQQIGQLLGFSDEKLDKFFESKNAGDLE